MSGEPDANSAMPVAGKPERHRNRRLRIGVGLLLALTLPLLGWQYWLRHRAIPPPVQQTLFEGVTYTREIRRSPRPLVINVITVDLHAPGIGFLVTPGDPNRTPPLRARTTSQFLQEFHVQVAVNADYFFPYHSNTPLDYYPHIGDPVNVEGIAASRGVLYSSGKIKDTFPTLYLSKENQASFKQPVGEIYNAVSGYCMILEQGQLCQGLAGVSLQPCTAVALDRKGQHLLIIMIDGRQPNYSEGVTWTEFADIIREHGGYTALNLDGGGSESLVAEGPKGQPMPLSSPIDGGIPGRERAVANHLGIFARKRMK